MKLPPYEVTERVQLGLKIVNPKTSDKHPISYRLIDTPGNISSLKKSAYYAFRKADIIFLLFDGSKRIDDLAIREWTMFTLAKIYQYHKNSALLRSTNNSESLESAESINNR